MKNVSSDSDGLQDNTTHWTTELSYEDYLEYQVSVIIWKICPPCILLLGGFGNIATICIMRRIKDHNSSQHAILMSLAVSDLTLLCTALPSNWILFMFQIQLEVLHMAICKLRPFLLYVSGITSAWLVTCVTVQRTMAVLWPHRMRVMCTVRRTWIVIATLVLSACAVDFHVVVGFEITEDRGCDSMAGLYRYFFDFYFGWIDLCIASFLPSVCMIVCDIILSVSLFKAVSSSSFTAARVDTSASTAHSRRTASNRTVVMVLALSCAFLLLTLPVCVYILWNSYSYEDIVDHSRKKAVNDLLDAAMHQLWYTNSAINFFLYCLTGTKFRREFLRWIRCCGAQSPSAPSVHEKASEASKEGRHQHHGSSLQFK